MKLFSRTKTAAKFVFVSMPLSIFGINQIRLGNQWIRELWTNLRYPTCPACDNGLITPSEQENVDRENGKAMLYAWQCNHCHWGFLETNDRKKVSAVCLRARGEVAKARVADMMSDERYAIARGHQLFSRTCFIVSALILCGAIYFIASGANLIVALNWMSMSFVLFVFGLKRSYRYWQITTNTLFEEGSFKRWFKFSKWIV